MFKRSAVCQAVALALALPCVAVAAESDESYLDQVSVSGYLKNETAVFTHHGHPTGLARTMLDDANSDAGDVLKFENSARMFLTGPLGEQTSWTADLQVIYESTGNLDRNYKGHRLYSQQDWLRELYVDTTLADWQFRLGKQQVVWGTADGIKLLDIINPTDYREFNQNTFEDSRIPVWMLKAEKNLTDRSSLQFIVSQHEENKIPGMDAQDNHGEAFIMKGVDTITGPVNGFLNIAGPLGQTATAFQTLGNAFLGPTSLEAVGGAHFTVNDFITQPTPFCNPGIGCTPGPEAQSAQLLYGIANTTQLNQLPAPGFNMLPDAAAGGGNQFVTNLVDPTYNKNSPSSAFEYMPDASFATFDTFSGTTTRYRRDYPSDSKANLGFRWKNTTAGGFSYSLNYFNAYDSNPNVTIAWRNAQGQKLTPYLTPAPNAFTGDTTYTVRLANPDGSTFVSAPGNRPVLEFTERVNRVNNFGAAFDMAIDRFDVPVVVRGEFLYQSNVKVPMVDRGQLAVGNLTEALTMDDVDMFKYVLGVDVTVLTNMMVSGQLIQFINLDYESKDSVIPGYRRYTADPTVMSMSNGMQKGDAVKNFYSLFFSKPFGDSQEHRWNNITIYEEGGGWWNRFDVEYSFTDNLLGTAEWNTYWGDRDSMFGQFKDSSNVQVGLKYLFD